MLTTSEKILFALAILATAAAFIAPLYFRFRLIRAARPDFRSGHFLRRLSHALGLVLLQKCTLKNERPFTGFMHVSVFYGALTFDTMTVNHTLEGFFAGFYLFGNTRFGLFFSLLVDIFALLVLAFALFFLVRRFIIRPQAYRTSLLDSGIIYFFLIAVTLSYLYFEAFSVAAYPDTARLSFLGRALADAVRGAGSSPVLIHQHFRFSWWLHTLLVFGFIAYVPHSKYLHMITGPLNVLFRTDKPSGEIKALDIEKSEVFGVEKAVDYTWKDTLDAFACMECGRCQDACPAFASGKPLSPKMIIYNLENHVLKESQKILAGKRDDLPQLMPNVYSEGEIWTCTTCGACQHVCPVEIEHIPKIVGVRQSRVLMEGQFPRELGPFFRNLETNFNPWGLGFSKRADWTAGLDVPLLRDRPQAEYLFWVGCFGSFDEEGAKISRAMAGILRKAGIDFAILGAEEKCCGDSARQLGNEYLYQTLARGNMELFNRRHVRRIITICPHGYNTFKNEYPALLDLFIDMPEEDKERLRSIEVIPHVSLIARLIREGRLLLRPGGPGILTYHDSCYSGRRNGFLAEPREILAALSAGRFLELERNREHSFCCGGGGGLMWTEETLGKRINQLRTEEIIRSGAELAATSCPFCLSMLRDGLKDKGKSDIPVRDIAQIVAESLADSG